MKTSTHNIVNANQAVALMAYKTNAVFPIYPITPASEMSELAEQWSAENKQNVFGQIPSAFQMQSEAGVAGAMHGALQTGSLSTTFTASQGLLLMLPNMYKIAGELTPNVIHVATRSIATHALSIFGDHSDVMAVRQSGYAMLASATVQEAHDFALISQSASLESRIPFVHFFDGFRTSHEINNIELMDDETILSLINPNHIKRHAENALTPNNPVLRGTSQAEDVFFQSREAINPFYNACPDIVQNAMDKFGELTGRHYQLFEYFGHPEAEHLIISMASSTETIESTINHFNKKGEKYGLIKVRLFRPFSTKHLISALPKSVKSIAVLDRTKEPGTSGEPLYLDTLQSIFEAYQNKKLSTFPEVIGGRYGLSSKEFTPSMVNAIFQNLKSENPKRNFTVGIKDDVTHLSLDISESININTNKYQAIFYHEKEATPDFVNALKLVGAKDNTFVQGYTQINYKKSNSYNISHLRIGDAPIKSPYLIEDADFIGCQNAHFTKNDTIFHNLKPEGTLLVNTSQTSKAFWQSLSAENQELIIKKQINLFIVNIDELKANQTLKPNDLSEFFGCLLAMKKDLYYDDNVADLGEWIYKVDIASTSKKVSSNEAFDKTFNESLLGQLLSGKGDDIPVSLMPADGTYPTDTSRFNPVQNNSYLPNWDTDFCTQCGACSMACPQSALRIKVYNEENFNDTPKAFKHIPSADFDLMQYTIQINPEQCNGCNNCVDACPVKALTLKTQDELEEAKKNWNYFETIPEFDRTKIDVAKVSQQQLQEPLFKYSSGVEGCGEAPYQKLMSQLFGDRLLIANATGASSIFGGALPTTPWAKNKDGHGPAWSNSLFEDNAEFGLGFRMSINQKEKEAKYLLDSLREALDNDLIDKILNAKQTTELEIQEQRKNIDLLNLELAKLKSKEALQLLDISENLIKKSVWLVGGDGWAYDIGYGGIDHVLASGENVNILVLDNEVYDNTGAQASKATPFGAQAKFAFNGKQKQKKDLGRLAMTYDNVYVASVAIGVDQEQTLKAFNEAESFNGPSIIIAYCHSASHGIDVKHPSQYHKLAVASGQWLLYRNDPRRMEKRLNPMQLDSGVPSIKIQEYLKLEKRFSKLFQKDEAQFKTLMKIAQKQVGDRFDKYLAMASLESKVNRNKLIQDNRIKRQLTYK
ncbi:4Fe-4S binding protein [Hyunsoonleella sp. SJ7]|uniref:4Fe-4S binding protein n=1 Tax=Hyunsoonleella aquatilis TaxID=2762758 RepID=A0A923KLL1_9FLAO|nr:4Fe-4S binding protein [Hyunsoonleella aquatilis]MBC3759592.1 4Fe-4S binding protein [Hyunsoonleella aquatilis]